MNERLKTAVEAVEERISPRLRNIDAMIDINQWKVIRAFQKNRVSDFHFAGSTGYGYNDVGREALDAVYAEAFGAEAGLVRPHFASGTHTIATALFALLRPGDELLFLTGSPYDTLHKVIGEEGDGTGSLADWGITSKFVPLLPDGRVDYAAAKAMWSPKVKVVAIQRSRGYEWRASFSVEDIGRMVKTVKEWDPNVLVFVDNCYGEFTEEREPVAVGVDLMAGSLIKNPGGGIAPTGGYIVGRESLVKLAAYRLTAPGIGSDVGSMLGAVRAMFQGFFLSPHTVGQALKGAVFAAALFEQLGMITHPLWNDERSDIIQAVRFHNAEQLISFVQSIQKASAVDAHVVPEPWAMPGYEHPVIMAAGTFIQGGSLELSADAPIREPYTAYMQGGLTYSHVKLGVIASLQTMINEQLL
nr:MULTISPECIES: methionine gamma-lyase family protein [unclassified Paenibacillus]